MDYVNSGFVVMFCMCCFVMGALVGHKIGQNDYRRRTSKRLSDDLDPSVSKPERFTDKQRDAIWRRLNPDLRDGPAGVQSYPDNIVELPDVSSDL